MIIIMETTSSPPKKLPSVVAVGSLNSSVDMESYTGGDEKKFLIVW